MTTWWAHAWLGGARTSANVVMEVEGDRFAAVTRGVTPPPPDATVLDGLVVPGLANAHSHAFHRALRGRTQDGSGSFWTWRDRMYDLAGHIDPDGYRHLAAAAFAEMARSGFTAVGEFHYLHHGPGGVPYSDPNSMGHALVDAAACAGIRLTLIDTCYLAGGFGQPLEGVQRRFGDRDVDVWAERFIAFPSHPHVRLGAAVHSVRAVPFEAIPTVAAQTDLLHAHVSEQPREVEECRAALGRTPLEVLADAGAVRPGFTAIHGTHLTKAEIAALGGARGGCCLCPTTERDLGDGIGPAADLHGAGVTLSIGTDSHAVIDGFEEARAVELDARLATGGRGLLSPADLLEAATAGGMKALGWDAGRLEPGALADLVELRLDTPRTSPCDPRLAATAVFAAGAADVETVVVGGRVVVEGGSHVALAMTSLRNIGTLVTCDPARGDGPLGVMSNATLVVDDGFVVQATSSSSEPGALDVGGRCVMPGFVDSHTHLVFAGDRATEFAERMAGNPYRPGGILSTVEATRAAPPDQLRDNAAALVHQALGTGTTTVEIKTGYGLDAEHEALHLGIARSLTAEATLLGAHVVPPGDRDAYIREIAEQMIPAAAGVARWCDAFCEAGAFDVDECREVLAAGQRHGLGLRVHANQLGESGGVALACEMDAASADHCTHLSEKDVDALAGSGTVATLLPFSDFCTRQPYPDARRLLDAGATVALATNCNPGSSYSTSMPLVLALAVRECGMTLDEALLAATRGGAAALRRGDIGRLSPGARADAVVLDAPHPHHLVYRLGAHLVWAVLRGGVLFRRVGEGFREGRVG